MSNLAVESESDGGVGHHARACHDPGGNEADVVLVADPVAHDDDVSEPLSDLHGGRGVESRHARAADDPLVGIGLVHGRDEHGLGLGGIERFDNDVASAEGFGDVLLGESGVICHHIDPRRDGRPRSLME